MNAQQFSDKLGGRKSGSGYQAKCPSHADKTASLSIKDGDNGKLIAYCHAGCSFGDIVTDSGLTMADVFPADSSSVTRGKPMIVAEYDYRDESGKLLYQALRMEPKTFRQRHPHQGGWNWSMPASIRRVLFRTPELSKAPQRSIVFVVEGEKDADRLTRAKLVAVTNIGGAGKWSETYSTQLRGHRVVIVPDNDDPGRKHARIVSGSLSNMGIENAILSLPNLPAKGDVSDWADAGGTPAKLLELAKSVLASEVNEIGEDGNAFVRSSDRLESAITRRRKLAKKVIPFNISFLDDICRGIHPTDLIILSADTGAGKTTMGALIARKAAAHGKRVSFFALEAFEDEIEQRMIYAEMIKLMRSESLATDRFSFTAYMYGEMDDLGKFEDIAARNIADELRSLKTFYRKEQFGASDITEMFKTAVMDSDLIVLDHLHYVDTDGKGENSDLKAIIKAIRNSTLEAEVPVIVIAHLRKKDSKGRALIPDISDIHGSSDVGKVATKVVMLSSLQSILPSAQPGAAHTLIQVAKDRYSTTSSYAGLMRYDLVGTDYAEGYALVRLSSGSSALTQLNAGQIPHWATRGKGCAGKIDNVENGKAVK